MAQNVLIGNIIQSEYRITPFVNVVEQVDLFDLLWLPQLLARLVRVANPHGRVMDRIVFFNVFKAFRAQELVVLFAILKIMRASTAQVFLKIFFFFIKSTFKTTKNHLNYFEM
jgi:hypothetical protein